MKLVALFLIITFCSDHAFSGRVQPKSLLTDGVRNGLENARPSMADIEVSELALGDLGTVENVTILNLDTFKIVELTAAGPLSLKVKNLTLTIDLLLIEGSYNLVNVPVPTIGNLSGEGNFSIGLQGVTLYTVLTFKTQGLTKVVLKSVDALEVNVALATAWFDGINGGQDTNDQISSILPSTIAQGAQDLLQNQQQQLVDKINELING